MENKVKIKLGNFEFEASGDSSVVERERKIIMDLIPQLIQSNSNNYNIIEKKSSDNIKEISYNEANVLSENFSSINQFIKVKKFGNGIDLTLGIIYYVEKYDNVSIINQNVLKDYYDKSKTKLPTNLSQNLSNLTQKGFIKTLDKEANGVINYSITIDGEEFIENYEPKEQIKKTKKSISKQSNNIKEEVVAITRNDLNLHEYKKLKDIKEFKGKMMAAIYIVSNNTTVDKFSVNDINYILLKIFQESNTIDQIKGVIKRETTWFNKTKNENTKLFEYELLREGIEYAEEVVKL